MLTIITKHSKDNKGVLEGIIETADITCSTLGPKGRTVTINNKGWLRITKDGVSVVKSIFFKKPYKDTGRAIVRDAAVKTLEAAGDGTTTTALLVKGLCELLSEQDISDPYEVRRGMDAAVDHILAHLQEIGKSVFDEDGTINQETLTHVATIAANGDTELGEKIAGLITKVGKNGVVMMEKDDKSNEVTTETIEGYSFDAGVIHPAFLNRGTHLEFNNPGFILINQTVENVREIASVLDAWATEGEGKNGTPLVIICNDMAGTALSTLIRSFNNIPFIPVKCPNEFRYEHFKDIQLITGTKNIYSMLSGYKLKDFEKISDKRAEFGTAVKFWANTKRSAIIFDSTTKLKSSIDGRVKDIQEELKKVTSTEREGYMKKRIARLQSGVGVIRVGAQTKGEQGMREDLVDDAKRACFSALNSKIVPGGGMALLKAPDEKYEISEGDFKKGFDAVMNIRMLPIVTMLDNAGQEWDRSFYEQGSYWHGLNIKTGEEVNLWDAGILDVYQVVENCLRNAVVAASHFVRTKYYLWVGESK